MKQNRSSRSSFKNSNYFNTINSYINEFKYLKLYIICVSLAIISSYLVFLFFDDDVVSDLGKEDHFFEWMTAIYLFIGFIVLLTHFIKSKNYFILLLSLVLFFGSGEEISWGQRIFHFNTPESIKIKNKQEEFTVHNLELFSKINFQGKSKKGFERLLEMNFLFRLFTMLWGIVLPFLVFHLKFVNQITWKLRIPVPPITIGVFFFINWITYWVIHTYIYPQNEGLREASTEVFESLSAFTILVICIYLFLNINKIKMGNDIKQVL